MNRPVRKHAERYYDFKGHTPKPYQMDETLDRDCAEHWYVVLRQVEDALGERKEPSDGT